MLGGEEHLDAARHPRPAADEPEALQREHHLMHGRRADPEAALHVALGRRAAAHAHIPVKVFADITTGSIHLRLRNGEAR